MKEFYSASAHKRHHPYGMAGDVCHLRAYGFSAEPLVKIRGNVKSVLKELDAHKLGVGGKGKRMPIKDAVPDSLIDRSVGIVFQRFVYKPRADRPDERSIRAFKLIANFYGVRNVLFKIFFLDVFGKIRESDVKMCFEDYKYLFHIKNQDFPLR
jgi:hypothetical protein